LQAISKKEDEEATKGLGDVAFSPQVDIQFLQGIELRQMCTLVRMMNPAVIASTSGRLGR
jgi:hypothetical protein